MNFSYTILSSHNEGKTMHEEWNIKMTKTRSAIVSYWAVLETKQKETSVILIFYLIIFYLDSWAFKVFLMFGLEEVGALLSLLMSSLYQSLS